MIDWGLLISKLFGTILSWLQSTNLRNQLYIEKEKNEIMRTALEDIQRMDSEGRMGWHAKKTIDLIDGRE
jgi:hypothetical protein